VSARDEKQPSTRAGSFYEDDERKLLWRERGRNFREDVDGLYTRGQVFNKREPAAGSNFYQVICESERARAPREGETIIGCMVTTRNLGNLTALRCAPIDTPSVRI
jgi:hypothetical protein